MCGSDSSIRPRSRGCFPHFPTKAGNASRSRPSAIEFVASKSPPPWGPAPKPPEFCASSQWGGVWWIVRQASRRTILKRGAPLAPSAAPVALQQSRILRMTRRGSQSASRPAMPIERRLPGRRACGPDLTHQDGSCRASKRRLTNRKL